MRESYLEFCQTSRSAGTDRHDRYFYSWIKFHCNFYSQNENQIEVFPILENKLFDFSYFLEIYDLWSYIDNFFDFGRNKIVKMKK